MLRLHLPPNLVAAAARDAVPLRLELNLAAGAPPPELLPVLALLQRWCGPTPPAFLQLSRAQLRDLTAAAGTQAIFLEGGRPTAWTHASLLVETTAPAPGPCRSGPTPARRTTRTNAATPPTPLHVDGSEHFLALTLPSREHPHHAEALALVREHGFALEPSNRRWWLRDRHKTLNFLAAHLNRLTERFGADFSANFKKHTAHLRPAGIVTAVAPAGDGFDVTLALEAGSASDALLRSALAGNRGYVESEGHVFLLDAARLEKLAAAQRALAGEANAGLSPRRSHRLTAAHAAEAQEFLEQLSPGFQPPESWRARSAALRDLTTLAPAAIPPAFDAQLRPYQRLGAAWLCHLHRHKLGGILADEMGLGKTLQALALLLAVRLQGAGDKQKEECLASLIVAPASLLENWRREAARFAPQLRVFVHHGNDRLAAPAAIGAYDVIITSYGTLARDQALFAGFPFACLVADEAQHIKNRRTQNSAALRALSARARFLLTGTPVENSLEDLRSLFEVLLPGYLARVPAGLRGTDRTWHDERLRAQTAPYILRRTKQAVAPELPRKLESIIWCELTPAQGALYRAMQERSERELLELEAAGASETRLKFAALTQLLRLRQICCDPRLVTAPEVTNPQTVSPSDVPQDEALSPPAAAPPEFIDSAKLNAFQELVAEAMDDGHRVLVFSQFTSLLALLRRELDAQQTSHCYLDGSMPTRARQAEVDRFQASPEIPLFLLSLKAGGTGLNLTGADTVVHFDPWWNPAVEAQATDRAHRIGQTRVVTSYKLIASGTVEEKVLALQDEKRALLAGVFEASDAAAARLTLADLKSLLAS